MMPDSNTITLLPWYTVVIGGLLLMCPLIHKTMWFVLHYNCGSAFLMAWLSGMYYALPGSLDFGFTSLLHSVPSTRVYRFSAVMPLTKFSAAYLLPYGIPVGMSRLMLNFLAFVSLIWGLVVLLSSHPSYILFRVPQLLVPSFPCLSEWEENKY